MKFLRFLCVRETVRACQKMKAKLLLAAIAMVTSAHADMTGSVRENYLREHAKGCYSNQRGNPQNSAVSDQTLRDYCACIGHLVSLALSNDDVAQIEAGRKSPDIFMAALNNSAKYCRERR